MAPEFRRILQLWLTQWIHWGCWDFAMLSHHFLYQSYKYDQKISLILNRMVPETIILDTYIFKLLNKHHWSKPTAKKATVQLKWDIHAVQYTISCLEFMVRHDSICPPQSFGPCVLTGWPFPHSDFWASTVPSWLCWYEVWEHWRKTPKRQFSYRTSLLRGNHLRGRVKPTPKKSARQKLSSHSSKFPVTYLNFTCRVNHVGFRTGPDLLIGIDL